MGADGETATRAHAVDGRSSRDRRIDEADEDQLKELDTLAWQIHDDVIGA